MSRPTLAATDGPPLARAPSSSHSALVVLVLTVATFTYSFQQFAVVPLLPAVQQQYGASTAWVTWLLTGFLLASCVMTPVLSNLGDQYGKRRMLEICLVVFAVGAAGAALAPNIWVLIACRVFQGASGAILPLSYSIVRDEVAPDRVGTGLGLIAASIPVGGVVAVTLSGVVADAWSWRYLFSFTVVIVVTAIVLVRRFVPASPTRPGPRVDAKGATLLAGALIALLVGLTEGTVWGWVSIRSTALLGCALVTLVAWAFVELNTDRPMVDVRMLSRRPVLLTNLASFIGPGLAFTGFLVIIPRFVSTPRGLPTTIAEHLDYGFGSSTAQAGLFLLPFTLAGVCAGIIVGSFMRRHDAKWPLATGAALGCGGIVLACVWHSAPWLIILATIPVGFGHILMSGAAAKLILDNAAVEETGAATGINSVVRQIGSVTGAQLAAAVLSQDTIAGTHVPRESAFVITFALMAAASLLSTVFALLVPARRSIGAEPGTRPSPAPTMVT